MTIHPEELREAVARIVLGPKSHWNTHAQDRRLIEWMFYPEVERAFAKADSILALISSIKEGGGTEDLCGSGAQGRPSRGAPTACETSDGWRPMATVPKYAGPVLLRLKADLPRPDLLNWCGRMFVGAYQGKPSEWCFAAPVGHGGFPDEWFDGWAPLPQNLAREGGSISRRTNPKLANAPSPSGEKL